MLAHAEPRGLPGTTIDRIALQRADDGFPLDDVIIHAHEGTTGRLATLQIQVKRSIAFSPSDDVFKKVAGQIAKAIEEPGFWSGRNELAIATSRGSRKIDGSYQDVLRWARQLGSAQLFFDRLKRPGTGNDDMRAFVETLRSHLRDAGSLFDDETIWKVLARLQIMVFDYTAVGSAAEELARERAVRVLPVEDATKASSLWRNLIDLSEEIAADGGDRDRPRLVDDLAGLGTTLAQDRRLIDVRATINEASSQALADIEDRIGAVRLARMERIAAVNEALGQGRYVEIRGDAGVGKSGILKHIAELSQTEGRILVLSPGRTQPRGWTNMKSVLGFNGTARDLLSDLASDGGSTLFIDNLDSFSDEERATVNDLVRAASLISGTSVVVTARRDFGIHEPSWLDADAVKALDPAPPVVIEELGEAEVAELREMEPRLDALLSDDHPARDVVRNLYRLSRLAARTSITPTPLTELDMAEQWWNSADGEPDDGRRDRRRLLRTLAEMSLGGTFALDVRGEASAPIDALVNSETLRDLGNDRVAFRHDVLRQWAVGNVLYADAATFEKLPLDKPAPAVLARGVELAAVLVLEREPNGNRWAAVIDRLSSGSAHGSWRRAALLAIVRSESSTNLMDREAVRLLDNDASLLRELIRTVMAVDVEPASQLLASLGQNLPQLPLGLFVPTGASWIRLIFWLTKLGAKLPARLLGDVSELYINWMVGTFGQDPLTPTLVAWVHAWLVELEGDRPTGANPTTYSGRVGYGEDHGLAEKLRSGFALFASKRPDLAVAYLNGARTYQHGRGVVSSIMKFRGTLAQAAPKELAALTAESLIAERKGDDEEEEGFYSGSQCEEPFEFLDHDFLPAAPAQGPFLELLTHAPDEGLALVQKLVDHALQFFLRGRDPGEDGFRIHFDGDERFFPWTRTYRWSRGESNYYAVASGLMALEAWAHQRVEAGADFDAVLKDVLGPPGTSAAFVLIAVDLIISHWPKSQVAAIPFLGCPELVSSDRSRQALDQMVIPDLFGLAALQTEPVGAATRESLKQRPSRNVPLERLAGIFGGRGPEALRTKLEQLLQSASQRLGAPEPSSNFADPSFMARHELNLIDPSNWIEREVRREDGMTVTGLEYVPPEAEARHLEALIGEADLRFEANNVRAALLLAIDNPSNSSEALVARGVAWARAQASAPRNGDRDDEDDEGEGFLSDEGVRAAAFLAIRDGSDELLRENGAWAEQILRDALQRPDNMAYRMRGGLKFNPIAIAFAGIAELYLRDPAATEQLRTLLEIAARESPAAAHGFLVAAPRLAKLDERIPKAITRCAFAAAVKPIRQWDVSEQEASRRAAVYITRTVKAVTDELAWLDGTGKEPAWSRFEAEGMRPVPRRRRGFRIGGPAEAIPEEPAVPPDTYVDEQAAGLWIGALRSMMVLSEHPWLRELVTAYADFSANLNGRGLAPDEELSRTPSGWNAAYYTLVAQALVGLSETEIDELAVQRIIGLPDEPFLDLTPLFLRAIDVIYFNEHSLEIEAPRIRQRFIDRLVETSGWRRLLGARTGSVEIHLGPAIGTIFFNDYDIGRTSTYLTSKAIERVGPFLPQLTDLLTRGPSYFAALVTMDLLEVSPGPSLLPILIAGCRTWVNSYSDDTALWVERGIGRRVCAWIDEVRQSSPEALSASKPERQDIDVILAALVRLGVPEARQVESGLASL